MFMSISGWSLRASTDDPDRADDEAQCQQAERLRRAPAPGGRLAHRQQDRRDPAAHQCRREPVHAPRDLHGRLGDEPPGAEGGRDDHGEREPEEPLPAEVLDDEAAEDDADPGADAEDGRDQPDPAGDLVERELVADDPEGEREDAAADTLDQAAPRSAGRGCGRPPRAVCRRANATSVQTRTCCLPNMSPRRPRSAVPTDAESR